MRPVVLFLTLLLLPVMGCRQYAVEAESEQVAFVPRSLDVVQGVPFELGVGQSAFLAAHDLSITLSFVVEDTRCPAVGLCESAGVAGVQLDLVRPAEGADRVVLLIPGLVKVPHHNNTVFRRGGRRYTLLDLTPYPAVGVAIAPGDYRALVVVD